MSKLLKYFIAHSRNLILFAFIVLKILLQYIVISPAYELQRDEFLHLDQAHHLAWGYTSIPPLTSWISYLILLLGNGVFWVKFFPALFGALTLLLVWKIVEALDGKLFALVLAATAVLASALLRINMLYQPNSFDILMWTAFYYTMVKYIRTLDFRWIWFAALAFAFGFLNKYNITFLLIGLFPALLLTEHRRLLGTKQFYGAGVLALLLIAPNLLWQYQNNFPVFRHLHELAATQLVNINRIDFFKEQLLFFFNSELVLLAAFVSFFIHRSFRKYRIFGWIYLFTMFVFVYFKAKGYYALGLYPMLLAFGAVYVEHLFSGKQKYYIRTAALIMTFVAFIPALTVMLPVESPSQIATKAAALKKTNLFRWEDGKDHLLPQDFADMLGWKELAQKVDRAYAEFPPNDQILVLCDNYGQAGAINYYSTHRQISAVSYNADYINWFQLEKPIRHVILVKGVNDSDSTHTKELSFFETVTKVATIENEYAREKGTRIYVLKNAKTDINAIVRKELADKRK